MDSNQVHIERRAAQRFDLHLPTSLRVAGTNHEGAGFTQDLSARGVFLYTDFQLTAGQQVELTLMMPSEITLGEGMRVRCRGHITRVVSLEGGRKSGVAVHFVGYEYLPADHETSRDYDRISGLHEAPQDEAGVSMHTFEWRGITPIQR